MMLRLKAQLSVFALLWLAGSASASDHKSGTLKISGRDLWGVEIQLHSFSRDDFKGNWPLTIDQAWLGCRADLPNFTVILFTGQDAWALNGTTRGWAKNKPYYLNLDGKQHLVATEGERWWWADETNPENFPAYWAETYPDRLPKISDTPLFDFVKELGCIDQ